MKLNRIAVLTATCLIAELAATQVFARGNHYGWCRGVGNPHQSSQGCGQAGGQGAGNQVTGPTQPVANQLPPKGTQQTPTSVTVPVLAPGAVPNAIPNQVPIATPIAVPGQVPTPVVAPTLTPPLAPNATPNRVPTAVPNQVPPLATGPTAVPPQVPTATPNQVPIAIPGQVPPQPTGPTAVPPLVPTATPNQIPVAVPGQVPPQPTGQTAVPPLVPTATPTQIPVAVPGRVPQPSGTTATPPLVPTATPNQVPTAVPGQVPQLTPKPTATHVAVPGHPKPQGVVTIMRPKPRPTTGTIQQPGTTQVTHHLTHQSNSKKHDHVAATPGRHDPHDLPKFRNAAAKEDWECVASGFGQRRYDAGRGVLLNNGALRHLGNVDAMARDVPARHPKHSGCIISVKRKQQ